MAKTRCRTAVCLGMATCAVLGATSALAVPDARTPDRSRANIILIMADDLGYECLRVYGSASYETPQLDRLAETGARFLHCYSQPLCTPTRVQIMTGRYNFRNYISFGVLAPGERTFGHMLREAGYATGVFGKWQLDGRPDTARGQTPHEAGFDRYCLWHYAQAKGSRYADPVLAYWDPGQGKEVTTTFSGQYGPEICAGQLCDFITEAACSGTPFFAYYPMILPHAPFVPSPDSTCWTTDRHAEKDVFFGDMIKTMDRLVGRIVAKVDELGIRQQTLILFTADNGTNGGIRSLMSDGRQIRGGKGYHDDSGTRVPLIANWLGRIGPGQVREDLVDTTDFLPTIADAAVTELPKPPGDGIIDGRSFLPQLLGEPARPRDWVFVSYLEARQDGFGWPRARFVRDRRYKFYETYLCKDRKSKQVVADKSGHLYDVANDRAELRPIPAADDTPESATARRQLQAVLERLQPPGGQ